VDVCVSTRRSEDRKPSRHAYSDTHAMLHSRSDVNFSAEKMCTSTVLSIICIGWKRKHWEGTDCQTSSSVLQSHISLSKKSFCISCFGCSSASETPWVAVAPYTPSAAKRHPKTHIAIIVSCLAQIPFPAAQYQLSLYLDASNIYSTVTDLAKFLGKSTLRPSATASQ
jgi:hypothetical protein